MTEGTETFSEDILCFFCINPLIHKELCRICQRPYCQEHTSPMDASLCIECVNLTNSSIKSEPLIDSEGVTKQNARRIILSGEGWLRERKLIANMTDIELDSYISAHQEAVHEAEMILDHRRIMLGHAKHQQAENYNKKVRARSERVKLIGAVAKVHNIAGDTIKDKSENISKALGALGKLGLTKDQIAAVLLNLTKNKPK